MDTQAQKGRKTCLGLQCSAGLGWPLNINSTLLYQQCSDRKALRKLSGLMQATVQAWCLQEEPWGLMQCLPSSP